jgi:hypothetical protein
VRSPLEASRHQAWFDRLRMTRLRWSLGVALVALGQRLPLIFQRHDVRPGGDSGQYVDLGTRLFSGALAVGPEQVV